MNIRPKQLEVILVLFVSLASFTMSCRLITMQVPKVIPTILPPTARPETLLPTNTPILSPSPTMMSTPVNTKTPEPTSTAVPVSGSFRLVLPVEEMLAGNVEALTPTSDGTLWLVTDQGVARLVDGTWNVYLSDLPGKIAGIDSTGRVWVAHDDTAKISAWNGQDWTAYGSEAGWIPLGDQGYFTAVHGGQSDLLGQVWFATSQDVRVFDGDRWTMHTPQAMGMASASLEDLATRYEVTILKSGVVWVSECDWGGPGPFGGQGIRWLEQGTWHGASSPVASGCATVIAEDSSGRVWAGVDSSLWRYDPVTDAWTEFAAPEPPISEMRFGFVDSLVVGPQDAVWSVLVLCGGASCYGNCVLYHFEGEVWTQVGEVGEFDYQYWGPIFDSASVPWIYWAGGVYRIGENLPELVSPLVARFGAIDPSGRVWLVARYNDRDTLWVLDEETSK